MKTIKEFTQDDIMRILQAHLVATGDLRLTKREKIHLNWIATESKGVTELSARIEIEEV